MIYNEFADGKTEFTEHVVNAVVVTPVTPSQELFNKVCFLGDGDGLTALPTDGQTFQIGADVTAYVAEHTELDNVVSSYRLFNSADLTQENFDNIYNFGYTLVLGSDVTIAYMALTSKPTFKGLLMLTIESNDTSAFELIVKQNNVGAMLDINKQGKAMHALTSMLKNGRILTGTNQIINNSFSAINDSTIANSLTYLGFSYYFKSIQKTYADSLFFGGIQAITKYIGLIVQYDVKNAISSALDRGFKFTDLQQLETIISDAVGKSLNNLIDPGTAFVPRVQDVDLADLNKGILRGVEVEYQCDREIRRVNIDITEN